MSGLAGIVHWHGEPVPFPRLAAMMALIGHRGPDGLCQEVRGCAGFGSARLALEDGEIDHRQSIWSPSGLALVADARIYNAAGLARDLRDVAWLPGQPSDAEVLLAGYERWGDAVTDRLDGDFAFAVWDSRTRRLFAARDPFGVRPFFYHASRERFVFGSEVKQVLLGAKLPAEADDAIVGEYVLDRFTEARHTFFRDVRRLRAGHSLAVTASGASERRHWRPDPDREIWYDSPAEYADPFRQLLLESVRKRLKGNRPVAAHVSGGLDSPSLAYLAQEACRQRPTSCPPVHTLSAVFPGLACDETPEIEACLRGLQFPAHVVTATGHSSTEGLADEMFSLDAPFAYVQRNVDLACQDTMRTLGVRRLMMGFGGDEVALESDYLRDLVQRGRYVRWAREVLALRGTTDLSTLRLMTATVGPLAPAWLKTLGRPLFRPVLPPRWEPPWWVNPALGACHASGPEGADDPPPAFRSAVQRTVFRDLAHPLNARILDVYEAMGARWGYELVLPFFDRPLAEFVLAIPFERRELGGNWKNLIRRSMSGTLPPELLRRRRKLDFDSHVGLMVRRSMPELSRMLLCDGTWRAERFVSRHSAERLFTGVHEGNTDWHNAAWRVATVELWLRGIARYTPTLAAFGRC